MSQSRSSWPLMRFLGRILTDSPAPSSAPQSESLKPAQLFAFILMMDKAILQNILFPMLGLELKFQSQLARVNRTTYALFQEPMLANQLLHLVARYEIKGDPSVDKHLQKALTQNIILTMKDGQQKKLENPILLLVSAIIKAYPQALFQKSSIVRRSGERFYGSPLEYICRSNNFVLRDDVLPLLIPNAAQKVAEQIAVLEAKDMSYDLILLPTLTAGKTLADLLPLLDALNAPALIKQINESGELQSIIQHGKINGVWQQTLLTEKLYLFSSDDFAASQAENLTNPLSPIQEGVVLVYEGEEENPQPDQARRYTVYFAKEGEWVKESNNQLTTTTMNLTDAQVKGNPLQVIQDAKDTVGLPDTLKLFADLPFPDSLHQAVTIKTTPEMYPLLKKGHSLFYDLHQYTRARQAFQQKYPLWRAVPETQWDECDRDWCKLVGVAQSLMEPWVAQLWCEETPFAPLPNFKHFILGAEMKELKLYSDISFYDSGLGVKFAIYKSAGLSVRGFGCGRGRGGRPVDAGAMTALCIMITESFEQSKQQLSSTAQESTPRRVSR
jgi:hypothetical protein